jgi:TorA maturation chaperone TorD
MNTAVALDAWHEECDGWAHLFDFASSLYLREPNMQQLEDCLTVGEALGVYLPDEDFPKLLLQAGEEDVSAIRQEFYDLFFVPVSEIYCAPYEALQSNGGQHDAVDGDIRRIFAETGFQPSLLTGIPSYLQRLNRPDYIGFELAFMANVFKAAAMETGVDEIRALRHTAVVFHEKHFSTWATGLGHQVAQGARSAYFKACGEFTAYMAGAFPAMTSV